MKQLLIGLILVAAPAWAQKPTVIVSGDGAATVVSVGTQGPEGPAWSGDINAPVFFDDFISGSNSGSIGALGWTSSLGGGSQTYSYGTGRPGTYAITPAATAFGTMHTFNGYLIPLSTVDIVIGEVTWATGASQPDSRFGMFSTNTGAVPSDDAVYFERTAADTNWYAVTRDGVDPNVTRTDTGVAFSAATYYTLEIRHPATGQWDFYIDGVLVASRTTGNIPAEATAAIPTYQIETNGTAVAMTVDCFFMKLQTAR